MKVEPLSPARITNRIKVFHVEDYKIMRDGIAALLNLAPEVTLVGSLPNGEGLLETLAEVDVNVLVMDIYLDAMDSQKRLNGFEAARLINEKYPSIRILIHSAYDDADRIQKLLTAGASGFVSKKSNFDELLLGIKSVYEGNIFICSQISQRLKNLNKFLLGIENRLREVTELFSSREREILTLLSEGKTSKEISEELFIAERTVESHRKNMIEKTEVSNTVELVAYAASVGLVKLE